MHRRSYFVSLVLMLAQAPIGAQDTVGAQDTETAPEANIELDEIRLKSGSVILGRVVSLTAGALSVETAFGVDKVIRVRWSEVAEIKTGTAHEFVLADGSKIRGRVLRTEDGSAALASESLETRVALDKITAIDPPPEKRPVTLTGSINFGGSISDGNTQTKTASFSANAVARSESSRLTLTGSWNYAEDNVSGITARNTKGSIKYDHFISKRFYIFASALVEEDRFQDLSMRTALSGGPGYQLYEKGDFAEGHALHQLEVYGEAGLAFFNEDFRAGPDQRYVSARWALRADLPISDRLKLFHRHEGYPGLENISDLYISTETGIAFTIWKGFISTMQVNWRWDNTPSPGFERSDTLYLWSLGYQFKI